MCFLKKEICFFLILNSLFGFGSSSALSDFARSKGFVYLHEVDSTILTSVRYNSNENFIGKPVDGYKKSVIILTKQTAYALKQVQEAVKKDGYSLVVYDAYRPQRAVNHFIVWSEAVTDQVKKSHYYPRVNKADVFELGYVAKRSGHTRGSTVDLTLIKIGDSMYPIIEEKRALLDGFAITFLDDGTIDMGSSFDLLDKVSHYENDLITEQFKFRRAYLKNVMEQYGFNSYSKEWWHFSLKNEPYSKDLDSSYFDFEVE